MTPSFLYPHTPTPLRVLMTADTVGGVWTYALQLAAALRPRGVSVALATMGAPLSADQWAAADRAGADIYESGYKLEWMRDPWEDVRAAGRWLLDVERRVRPDVVHLNGYAHAALCWSAPTLVVGHSCVLSWWRAVKGEGAPPEWERYRREVARGLHAADLVAAPTAAMLGALGGHYGQLDQTMVVHNGRDAAAFPPGRKEPLVLSAGRLWDEAKNAAALESVAPRLDWPVYLAGQGDPPEEGERPARRHAGVRCLGMLPPDRLAQWMGRASIYALPARYEPFGLSALEAALAGCALVLGDIPTLREVWGDAAVFVDPNDPAILEVALNELIHDDNERQRLAARARRRALELTSNRMAEGYLRAYREMMNEWRGEEAARDPDPGLAPISSPEP